MKHMQNPCISWTEKLNKQAIFTACSTKALSASHTQNLSSRLQSSAARRVLRSLPESTSSLWYSLCSHLRVTTIPSSWKELWSCLFQLVSVNVVQLGSFQSWTGPTVMSVCLYPRHYCLLMWSLDNFLLLRIQKHSQKELKCCRIKLKLQSFLETEGAPRRFGPPLHGLRLRLGAGQISVASIAQSGFKYLENQTRR